MSDENVAVSSTEQTTTEASTPAVPKGHPKGLYYLFGTEAMERFSYYGMRAILVLYLTAATTAAIPGIGLTRADALSIYAIYTSLVYLTPLLGGMLADKYLGARKSIFIGGLVMMFGEFSLMLSSATTGGQFMLYLGLALLILGNGFFKPNASTIVGELYEPKDPRRDGAFTIFYMGINAGAFFSPIICGTIGENFGFKYGFACAAIGMALGIVIFMLGQRSFGAAGFPRQRKVDKHSRLSFRDNIDILWITLATCALAVLCVVLLPYINSGMEAIPAPVKAALGTLIVIAVITGLFGLAYKGVDKDLLRKIENAKAYLAERDAKNADNSQINETNEDSEDFSAEKIEEMERLAKLSNEDIKTATKEIAISDVKSVAAILLICLFVIFFWLGFEQAGGTMTLFAQEETDRFLFGKEIPASLFQSINPLFILILAPIFTLIWKKVDSMKSGFSVVYKMVIALCLMGLGFLLLYAGQATVVRDASGEVVGKASMLFLIGVYFLHTCGELCLSPIGLSFITKLSPARMVSLMMGVWLLTSAIANFFAGNLEAMLQSTGIPLFAFLVVSSFGTAAALFAASFGLRKWLKGY